MTVVKINKQRTQKKCVIKRKLKFQNYKNCLESASLDNKINKTNIDCLKKHNKKLIRNNKLILKTQQIFKSERHNVFTEAINQTALSSNDDKRMQSFNSVGTYKYGMSKDPVSEKVDLKCNNIIKRYKKRLTLMML